MKRITLCLPLIAAALFTGCKKEPNVVPETDTEVQSAIDVAFATYVITDIDMMCSYMGENTLLQHPYIAKPGSASGVTGTMTATRDTMNNTLTMSFNKTTCLDGRVRDGSVYMDWEDLDNIATNNDNYMRDYKYRGRLALLNYKVDGWLVDEYNDQFPAYIYNTLTRPDYSTSSTKVTWSIEGKFRLIHPLDSNRNMVWDGKLKKTLENTSNKRVMDPSKQKAIVWDSAIISYSGKVTGLVSRNVPFAMEITDYNPLVRDFRFDPNANDPNYKFSNYPHCQEVLMAIPTVTTGGKVDLKPVYSTHHPFIKGIASFTPGINTNNEKYPRQIYFGGEGNADLPYQCDNKGEVLIKGISYPVDFMN